MSGPVHRAFRRLAIAGGMALALAAGCGTAAAEPGYVFYYRTFGDWTVICALDEPTGRRHCRLGAPAPSLGGNPGEVGASLDIVDPDGGEAAIVLRVRPVVDAGRPAIIEIDQRARHESALARTGEAVWRGAEAAAIIAGMAAGNTLSVRFVPRGGAAEVERRFSLAGFAAARQAYRQRIAAISRPNERQAP